MYIKLITMNIKEDNLLHLNRYKIEPPHPSYIAGFIDGDGCIFIRKIKDGYQSGITLTQCRTNILQVLRYHFGGSITSSKNRNNKTKNKKNQENDYYYKYNKRNQYNLLVRSNEYEILLNYIKESIIIKKIQIDCLYEIYKIVNQPNELEKKENYYTLCLNNNIKTNIIEENLSKINIQYIQGLFDAEGCIFINIEKFYFRLSISQKNHPNILDSIKQFLGFGKVYNYNFIIYNKNDCLKFTQLIKNGLIVKYKQACAFETFLTTNDKSIKEEMYKICNEEKHEIEYFTELNKQTEGKEGYLDMIHLRELKQKIGKEIILKQIYKEKSEKMKGNGNHNFGKKLSEETKKKMSTSIRDSKGGVTDDMIIQVRNMVQEEKTNCEIAYLLNLPKYTISRIKNGNIVCRNEDKLEKKSFSQEEINLSKRKIRIDEILFVIEKCIENVKPSIILTILIDIRNKNNIKNTLTIDIIKNIKRNIQKNKIPFYPSELSYEKYNDYKERIQLYANECDKCI